MATVLTSSSDDLPESQRANGAVEDVSQSWNFCSCFVFLLKKVESKLGIIGRSEINASSR